METTAYSKKLTVAALVVVGLAAAANAQIIFKADQTDGLVVSGGNVTSWSDTADTANYTLAPTGTAPTFGVSAANNNQGYVSFGGAGLLVDDDAALGGAIGATQTAMFLVLRATGAQNKSILTWDDTNPSSTGSTFLQVSENLGDINHLQRGTTTTSAGIVNGDAPTWDGDFHLLTLVRNGNVGQIRIDGVAQTVTGNFSASGSMPLVTSGDLTLGGRVGSTSGDRWSGDIAEVRFYNTIPNIEQIEMELDATYNLNVVPEPSEYAMIFGLACVAGALALRYRRQTSMAR
jgi:hypothetical protein